MYVFKDVHMRQLPDYELKLLVKRFLMETRVVIW